MFSELKERVRLEGILMSLAVTMYLVSRFNRDFREDLRERNGIAEIRTADWGVAWCFYISHGNLRIARGSNPNPDYAMVYKDVPTALAVMTKGTEEAFMQAMMDGTLVFEGDMAFGMWFNDLMKKLGNLVKEKMEALPLKRFVK
jgi:putative sterol carrier protein